MLDQPPLYRLMSIVGRSSIDGRLTGHALLCRVQAERGCTRPGFRQLLRLIRLPGMQLNCLRAPVAAPAMPRRQADSAFLPATGLRRLLSTTGGAPCARHRRPHKHWAGGRKSLRRRERAGLGGGGPIAWKNQGTSCPILRTGRRQLSCQSLLTTMPLEAGGWAPTRSDPAAGAAAHARSQVRPPPVASSVGETGRACGFTAGPAGR